MINLAGYSPHGQLSVGAESALCPRCGSFAAICTCSGDARNDDATAYDEPASGEISDSVDLGVLTQAYESRFSETLELSRLWDKAAEGGRSYDTARTAFWGLVNQDEGADAAFVRAMLEAAGFAFGRGTEAPMLSMEWDDYRSGRLDAARRLSIDHATPQSRDPSLATDPNNLRFMLQDDNSRRGARWTANDRRYSEVCPGCWVPSPGGVRCQTCVAAESQPQYLPDS